MTQTRHRTCLSYEKKKNGGAKQRCQTTRKKHGRGGGWFQFAKKLTVADNDLVTISYQTKPLKCTICSNKYFQRRLGTFGKSKLANIGYNMVLGDSADTFEDISVTCYFCNQCGQAIIVRDPKASTEDYQRIITSTKAVVP
jgi:hypothetical protein